MNFLLVTSMDLQGTGGLIVRYQELPNALGKEGNKVHLIGITYDNSKVFIKNPNVQVQPINLSIINTIKAGSPIPFLWQATWAVLFSVKCFFKIIRISLKEHIDVCISYTAVSDIFAYFACRMLNVFWIYDIRSISETEVPKLNVINKRVLPIWLSLEHFCAKRANRVLVVSEQMKKVVLHFQNLNPSKITVNEDGVDTTTFNPDVQKGLLRSTYRIPQSDPVILYVGSVSMAKGIDRLITAMPHILRASPNAKLVIVGGGSIAVNDSKNLKQMVIDSGLTNSVIFTGRVKQVAPLMIDADICVAPSSLYFSPVKVYEYLACARPVVLDKHIDIAKLLVSNNAAAAVDTADPVALSSTIVGLLHDPDKAERMGMKGFRIVTDNFTWEIIASKLTNLLKSELAIEKQDFSVPISQKKSVTISILPTV